MSTSDLTVFFRPKGVAVLGASRDPHKLGYGVLRNLTEGGYTGMIYPINRRANEILGLKVYPTIAELPDPVDLAVIVIPAPYVENALRECGERGIKAAIIVSGGFRETGAEGIAREEAIKQVAKEYGIRMVGPNCIGSIDTHTPVNLTFVTGSPRPGEIGLVSQSGAVAAAIIDWAVGAGVGLSRVISMGNQADISEAEMLAAVATDPETRVITTYIEGVSDGEDFVEVAMEVSKHVPIVALKVGRGQGGAKAIASHTGALAGDDATYEAAFRRAGVLRASSLEEMFDWARALAWQPLPQGNRVAVLTNAGGPAILALDAMEDAGLVAAPLTEETKAYLRERVFAAASVQNPVDILAGAGPATYAVCLDALLADETVDAVVVIQAPQDWFTPVSLAEVLGEMAGSRPARNKPILSVLMGLASTGEAVQVLHRRKIPNYAFPVRVGSTLAAMWRRKQWLDALADEPVVEARTTPDRESAELVMEASLSAQKQKHLKGIPGSGWMGPEQIEALLKAYHIEMPGVGLAPSLEHALPMAQSLGYPVAMKLAAEGLVHKSDVGGVVVNIDSPESLEHAYTEMMLGLTQRAPELTVINGVYIQNMVRGEVELIIGMVRDPQFSPLIMVGLGGTTVEVTRDVAFELAPLSRQQATDLIDRTSAGRILRGYRGASPADIEAAVNVIMGLSQVSLDFPQIMEIEVNPLIVLAEGDGAYAVDVRVLLDLD